jgi:hypothetical protein
MGDFRMTVQVRIVYLDKEYVFGEGDGASINYDGFEDGIDPRVRDFLQATWNDCQARYRELAWESQREERQKEQERHDRAEFERLKAKYNA